MHISPDQQILWRWGFVTLNATIVCTWIVIVLLVGCAWLLTRKFDPDKSPSRLQLLLEILIESIQNQIRQVGQREPGPYFPFIATLFLFIATANLLGIVPFYVSPTASLSTAAALALCVFVAVPLFGIQQQGLLPYLKQYARPSLLMLPFNIIGELSRTLALAVRLFGNVMSGRMIVATLLLVVPLFFPVVMDILGLLTGMIQAYIFAILAMVYIASATQHQTNEQPNAQPPKENPHE